MSWSYWINLILFHIFYWQLYSSLLSSTCCLWHGAKNVHLHLNSVTKIITLAAFRRQYSATNFLLLPKITYIESSDSRQFSTVLSYWTKHRRHHNKITIWIVWHNTTLWNETLRAAWWTSPASWWSPASSPRWPGPPARGSGTGPVSLPVWGRKIIHPLCVW